MSALVVVTHPGLARGYRLAGVPAEAASDSAQADRTVAGLLERGDVAVIAIDADLLAGLSAALRRRIESGDTLCVALPPAFAVAEKGSA